jgi:hypothetical protein
MPAPGRTRRARPADPAEDDEARRSRRRRASEEALDVRLRSRAPVVELEVLNPVHGTRYRVFLPEYPSRESALCTCTDFARRGLGTCKHVEAALAAASDLERLPMAPADAAPALPVAELWSEVERRLDGLQRHPPEGIRALERAGRPLIEGLAPSEGDGEGAEGVGRPRRGTGRPTRTSPARP